MQVQPEDGQPIDSRHQSVAQPTPDAQESRSQAGQGMDGPGQSGKLVLPGARIPVRKPSSEFANPKKRTQKQGQQTGRTDAKRS